MSAMSDSAIRPENAPGLSERVRFWLVLALVLVAATACAFVAAMYVADGADVAPFFGP